MKLNKNIELIKQIKDFGIQEYNGTVIINVRALIDSFYADEDVKSALERLAK